MFYDMFQLVFRKKATEYGQKEHEELKQVFLPFVFSMRCMSMMVDFHWYCLDGLFYCNSFWSCARLFSN
jgi:hypothetical protein